MIGFCFILFIEKIYFDFHSFKNQNFPKNEIIYNEYINDQDIIEGTESFYNDSEGENENFHFKSEKNNFLKKMDLLKNNDLSNINNDEDYFKLNEIKKSNFHPDYKNVNFYKENPKKKNDINLIKKNLNQSSKLALYANFNCNFFL